MRRCYSTQPANRRGVTLIYGMIALTLVALLGTLLVKSALMQHRQARREQRRAQSQWLTEAALERAAARLATNPAYKGETWNVSSKQLDGRSAGRVLMTVESVPDKPDTRRVTVTAEYPVDTPDRSRTTKTVNVFIKQQTPSETSR